MKVHFIAIGGAAMHNLAIALHEKGVRVTGSDDEINDPSKSRLQAKGLLPDRIGWYPERITADLDAVILGMHARADNPELEKAKALGLPVYSYPEYLYQATLSKTRVVVGGSHGKTTTTAMIMHALRLLGANFDYLVGAQLDGFETMVRLSNDAPVAILEGDEYLSSPLDPRPKFHLYHPQVAVLTGVAWDHINVFPTFEGYVDQFRIFLNTMPDGGVVFYAAQDEILQQLADEQKGRLKTVAYGIPKHRVEAGITLWMSEGGALPLGVFGEHNLQNLEAARLVCEALGFSPQDVVQALSSFRGAARRLERVGRSAQGVFYRDFAHSPSKLKATVEAVRTQYPGIRLVACMELHTFSSLNRAFLAEYHETMMHANEAFVYYNPKTIAHKKLEDIQPQEVAEAFGGKNLRVFTDSNDLVAQLHAMDWSNSVLLMMSSGTFDGISMPGLAADLGFALAGA